MAIPFLVPLVLLAPPAPAPHLTWPLKAELFIAADALSYAPPDLKRQLVRHRAMLMEGLRDAHETETYKRDEAGHIAAAARGARALATAIRGHARFSDVAYQLGGIVHELAVANFPAGPPPADAVTLITASKKSAFLGFPAQPFRDPDALLALPLPQGTPRQAFDRTATQALRLLAWIWKTAGGDASITSQYPESKGPYVIRE